MNAPLPNVELAGLTLGERDTQARSCPRCGSARINRWGLAHGFPRFRCTACGKTFNVRTNTTLARLRKKDQWLTFVGTLVEGRSIRKSAVACGISAATVMRWRKRFGGCTPLQKARVLVMIVDAMSRGGDLAPLSDGMQEPLPAWCADLAPVLLAWML
ncbi:MAG TPA: helix-turn-helix domain-containing protein [Burkholderiales bacterium]|nr:helix-turn-helix domain-containing protein [Burkholderiales bacterium]